MLILILIMNVMDCTSSSVNMECFENRLNSFDTYPKQMLPDKYQLAQAGLYYTGKSDVCQCFSCNVKLSAWERDDDAIKEQYKWSPNYTYIKMIGAPPQRQTGFMFGSSAPLGGFGTGSNNFVRTLDPKHFQSWRDNSDESMWTMFRVCVYDIGGIRRVVLVAKMPLVAKSRQRGCRTVYRSI